MAEAHAKLHDYHLVNPSPWPIVGAIGALSLAVGAIMFFISKKAGSRSVLHKGYYWVDHIVQGDIADGRNAHHLRKGVITPFGNFESTREAGRVIGINHATITKRIRRGDPGYSYIK